MSLIIWVAPYERSGFCPQLKCWYKRPFLSEKEFLKEKKHMKKIIPNGSNLEWVIHKLHEILDSIWPPHRHALYYQGLSNVIAKSLTPFLPKTVTSFDHSLSRNFQTEYVILRQFFIKLNNKHLIITSSFNAFTNLFYRNWFVLRRNTFLFY